MEVREERRGDGRGEKSGRGGAGGGRGCAAPLFPDCGVCFEKREGEALGARVRPLAVRRMRRGADGLGREAAPVPLLQGRGVSVGEDGRGGEERRG